MIKINSIGKFNTSFGIIHIVDNSFEYKVGQQIVLDGKPCIIEKVMLSSRPGNDNVSLIVRYL